MNASFAFRCSGFYLLLCLLALGPQVHGQEEPGGVPENDAISELQTLGKAYEEAFNQHDAAALAAFWSPTAVYTNRLTGEQITGREAIAAQFTSLFESLADCRLEVEVESLDLLSPNVAVEKGVATLVTDQRETTPYTAVYVRQADQWLLDRVTDDPQPQAPSHYEQLKSLEFLVGSWIDQGEGDVSIEYECKWTKNRNYLTRMFAVTAGGQIDLSGMQIIGWDPREKQIRSWTFDSDGSFAQARWSNDGDHWYMLKKGTTADGRRVSGVNVLRVIDDNTHTLEAVQRTVDGSLLPDMPEVAIVRQ